MGASFTDPTLQDHAKSFCAVVLYPFEPKRGAALVVALGSRLSNA